MRTKLSLLVATAALITIASNAALALTVPVAQDTYSGKTGVLTNAAGKASFLFVTDDQTALLDFDLSNLNVVPASIDPANIKSVILQIYVIETSSTNIDLTVHAVTSPWSETFGSKTAPMPTIDSTVLATIPMAELPPNSTKGFVSVDITGPVVAALESGTDLSIAIETATHRARVLLGSKDGPAFGYAAELDIDCGVPGPANTLTIGTVTSGTAPSITLTGSSPNQILNLILAQGPPGAPGTPGETGPANSLTIGTVTSGTVPGVTLTGTSPSQVLNITLPQGDTGPQGPSGQPFNPLQVALLKWAPNTVTSFSVGNQPNGICFDGANVWVANQSDGTVTKLYASTGATIGTYSVGNQPNGICFDGANVWVANKSDGTVTKLNASTGTTLGTYNVGMSPQAICFDGTSIWVTNYGSANVTRLNASTGTTLGTYNVGTNPFSVCFDGTSIWVANYGNASKNLTKLNASTGAFIGTYGQGTNPRGICFDGANIWVADDGGSNVTKLNASTGATIATYNAGTNPYGVCFDGANIWVTNHNSNNVTEIDVQTGTVIGTYPIGVNPAGICFDGANIWVANSGGNTVGKL